MRLSNQSLVKKLAIVLVFKLAVLLVLWWFFVRDARVLPLLGIGRALLTAVLLRLPESDGCGDLIQRKVDPNTDKGNDLTQGWTAGWTTKLALC